MDENIGPWWIKMYTGVVLVNTAHNLSMDDLDLVYDYHEARLEKDYARSDYIRDTLLSRFEISDDGKMIVIKSRIKLH